MGFSAFLIICILVLFVVIGAFSRTLFFNLLTLFGSTEYAPPVVFRHKKKLSSLMTCILVIVCAWGALGLLSETDEGRFMTGLYLFMRDVGGELGKAVRELPDSWGKWNNLDEMDYVKSEDPEGVRMLFNMVGAYEENPEMPFREPMELRVSRTRVSPGERVYFVLTPSPEAPKMPSKILIYANPLKKTVSLKRARNGTYRGSLKFKKTDSGVYRFGYFLPRFSADEIVASNMVAVFVAPQGGKLSRIYIQESRPPVPMMVHEGDLTRPTLFGEASDGTKYDITGWDLGARYFIEDERKAVVSGDEILGVSAGETTLRVVYGGLEAEAALLVRRRPTPEDFIIPGPWRDAEIEKEKAEKAQMEKQKASPISPPDGTVVHVGEKVILEASPVEIPGGPEFSWSNWRVCRADNGREVAYLRGGNSNTAEWIPRGAGTFDWSVAYSYAWRGPSNPYSEPRRIIVVEKQEASK